MANAYPTEPELFMPDEGAPHRRTWIAFIANEWIWSKKQIPEVKKNLALIARTIAQYEPVSMLVSPHDKNETITLLGDLDSYNFPIELIEFTTDDLWLRDTGPTFVTNSRGQKIAIDFNFNGWGEKQDYKHDAEVARFIASQASAVLQETDLVLEGGCFEVDGHGNAILTRSCILNDNRNPDWSQQDVEQELMALLGLENIIWLNGIKGKDITDGHTDFYARFGQEGQILISRDNYKASHDYAVTRENISILENSRDKNGKSFDLIILDTPDYINEYFGSDDFAAGYIGYYVCNDAVIMQGFGDKKADANAKAILADVFPDRLIEQIRIDGIASGGGSIHCATQQEILI